MTRGKSPLSNDPATCLPDAARSNVERGMALMAAGVLMTPGVHAIAKSLGDTLSVGQISAARYFFQLFVLLPLVWFAHRGRIPPPRLSFAILGLLLAAASVFFFLALTFMPLADSAAIFFVEPLLLALISFLFLGEPMGLRRLAAILVGFAGALIVIRPSFQSVGPAALLPLLAGACFAIFLASTRRLSQDHDARAMQLWTCIFAVAVLSAGMALSPFAGWELFRPTWPKGLEWALLGGMGVIALVSQMLSIQALRVAPAGILAPFQYLEIFGATILGAFIFADLPDGVTMLGIAIIVGSGLYVFHRERMLARRPVK